MFTSGQRVAKRKPLLLSAPQSAPSYELRSHCAEERSSRAAGVTATDQRRRSRATRKAVDPADQNPLMGAATANAAPQAC